MECLEMVEIEWNGCRDYVRNLPHGGPIVIFTIQGLEYNLYMFEDLFGDFKSL